MSFNFLFFLAVISAITLVKAKADEKSADPSHGSTTPPANTAASPVPCSEQYYYYFAKVECTMDQLRTGGIWYDIDLDPAVCSGRCEFPNLPTNPSLPPCAEQFEYMINQLQCGEDPSNPGYWIPVNMDPSVCEGYCQYTSPSPLPTTPGTTEPPAALCDIEKLKSQCVATTKGESCKIDLIDVKSCQVWCSCDDDSECLTYDDDDDNQESFSCDKNLARERLECMQSGNRCFFEADLELCQADCICEDVLK